MNWKYLVILDIGGIHEYIFATNKLKEVRGASILLDNINRKEAIDCLKNFGTEGTDYECLVARGGNIKVLFTDRTKAEQYTKRLINVFNEKAHGAGITVTICEKENAWTEKKWLDNAEAGLNKEKLSKAWEGQIITSGYFKTCQACGINPAGEEDSSPDGTRMVCKGCFQKIQNAQYYTKMEIYQRLLERLNKNALQLPKDFGAIGETSKPKGYIGFIYADGNMMGKKLETIENFDELKTFSADIEKANFEATITAITNHFKSEFPFQIILAGGDDLIMAVPANKAINIAIDFCRKFNKNTHGVTTSAAVVICHDSLPIKNVLETAEGLLKNAKATGRQNGGKSYIDFIATSGSAIGNPIHTRKKELEIKDYAGLNSLTMRPYPVDMLNLLKEDIKALKKANFPNNKLKTIYSFLFKGHHYAYLEGTILKQRLKEEQCTVMEKIENDFSINKFPWHEIGPKNYATPLGDIVELYEFIEVNP